MLLSKRAKICLCLRCSGKSNEQLTVIETAIDFKAHSDVVKPGDWVQRHKPRHYPVRQRVPHSRVGVAVSVEDTHHIELVLSEDILSDARVQAVLHCVAAHPLTVEASSLRRHRVDGVHHTQTHAHPLIQVICERDPSTCKNIAAV